MSASAFQARLARGLVIHLALGADVLDDPQITSRDKFIVVLNHFCPDDPIYFVMATSQLKRFESNPMLGAEVVGLDPGTYDFLSRPTVLDFTGVKSLPLIDLTALHSMGNAQIVGQLTIEDLVRCDAVIRSSRFIEPRITPMILPW